MIFSISSVNSHHKDDISLTNEVVEEDSLFQDYIDLGVRLEKDSLLTIDPVTFAAAAIIVHYSESNIKPSAVGKDQTGIFQITDKNRKALNIPDLTNKTRKEQLVYYEKYLRSCRNLNKVKTCLDLHVLNFSPSRFNSKVLSKVTNKWLKALDKTRDGIITRKDLALFQKKRVRCSNQTTIIYDQMFKNNIDVDNLL